MDVRLRASGKNLVIPFMKFLNFELQWWPLPFSIPKGILVSSNDLIHSLQLQATQGEINIRILTSISNEIIIQNS